MIYFIGAGPGAKDLITVRGMRLLRQAKLVIYAGSLVNPELLEYCGPDCKLLNSASMTLEQVIDAFREADPEAVTVRLHTGDPSIYGAIREQMDALDALGLSYEVVPGVSAMNAAAAVLHAEYTLPGVSQTVIVSRRAGRTPMPEGESIPELAAHGASMALFLSAGMLRELCAELIQGGYAPETPAAIVYKATWPDQRIYRCTVGTLGDTVRDNGLTKTSLIVVGGFLGDNYDRSKLYDPGFTTEFRQAER